MSSTCCAVVQLPVPALICRRGEVRLNVPPAAPLTPNPSIERLAPTSSPPSTASSVNAIEPPVPEVSAPLELIHAPPLACRATSAPSESSAPFELTPKLIVPPFCQFWESAVAPGVSQSLVHRPLTSSVTPSPT